MHLCISILSTSLLNDSLTGQYSARSETCTFSVSQAVYTSTVDLYFAVTGVNGVRNVGLWLFEFILQRQTETRCSVRRHWTRDSRAVYITASRGECGVGITLYATARTSRKHRRYDAAETNCAGYHHHHDQIIVILPRCSYASEVLL